MSGASSTGKNNSVAAAASITAATFSLEQHGGSIRPARPAALDIQRRRVPSARSCYFKARQVSARPLRGLLQRPQVAHQRLRQKLLPHDALLAPPVDVVLHPKAGGGGWAGGGTGARGRWAAGPDPPAAESRAGRKGRRCGPQRHGHRSGRRRALGRQAGWAGRRSAAHQEEHHSLEPARGHAPHRQV